MQPKQKLLNLGLEYDYKMKVIIYIFVIAVMFSCNSEDANDCIQNAGNGIQTEVMVSAFERILVNRDVELILKEGADYQVIIESGENLINDIEAVVVSNELQLTDYNTCNYVREYGITKVYVTAPNIKEIRSSTQYDISSDGVLNYSNLKLFSEDSNVSGTFTVGDFKLNINSTQLNITANNISSFYISGQVENAFIGFYSGIGRFEGANLIAQNIEVYHRGSNDMVVNPQQSLRGQLLGSGDLISLNNPLVVEVEQIYTGQLIFN